MQLMWWEAEQLIDHINSRPDIWSNTATGQWLRQQSYEDSTGLLGIAITGLSPKGPFQKYTFTLVPLFFTKEQATDYFTNLCIQWTDYGQRERYTRLLIAEGNIDAAKAGLLATALCATDYGVVEGYSTTTPTELIPDIRNLGIIGQVDERAVRAFGITGGGWLRVSFTNGMLKVRASLRTSGDYGGGFGGEFEGFIRPSDGNVQLAAAFLLGGLVRSTPLTEVERQLAQQCLRSVTDSEEYVPHIQSPELLERRPSIGSLPDSERDGDLPQPEPGADV